MINKFSDLLKNSNIILTQEKKITLLNYVELLNKWNRVYNLTSLRNCEEMLSRHIIDSLIVSPYLKGDNFIDVGTGAGLPGIPLAIMHPEKHFTLIDSRGKKVNFLLQAKNQLVINNIFPVCDRVENFCTENLFDGIISRAFASLNDMVLLSRHLKKNEGYFYALKGKMPQQEIESLSPEFRIHSTIRLPYNHDGERHLIVISSL